MWLLVQDTKYLCIDYSLSIAHPEKYFEIAYTSLEEVGF